MALLLQSLREVRARRGDREDLVGDCPTRSRWSGVGDCCADWSAATQIEALTDKAETPCSEHFSSPESTESA